MHENTLRALCPATASLLAHLPSMAGWLSADGESLVRALRKAALEGLIPTHAADVCALELTMNRVTKAPTAALPDGCGLVVNPALELLVLETSGCAELLRMWRLTEEDAPGPDPGVMPVPGREMVLVWRHGGRVMIETAGPEDLAALKVVAEGIDPSRAEAEAKAAPGVMRRLLRRAAHKGLLLAPPSRIRRDPALTTDVLPLPPEAESADVFTLQWHLTQACDLSCRHCYDRSARNEPPLSRAMEILDDFRGFCAQRNVRGQLSLSGGNPLLYPHFLDVYRRAADEGFALAILGNPTPRRTLEEITDIARPVYFQVSLEGLPEHNDAIRGSGHFERVMAFLDVLQDLDIQGQVMLTLTRDNMSQVLPLAELLEGRVWGLAFNRLSPVGRGAALALPDPDEFQAFLESYCDAAGRLSVLSFKDNMLGAHLARTGRPSFGGCTGFGCGAAFNFMALLPDGEVHACRKFPSLIGDIEQARLGDIYDGPEAVRYRTRSQACRTCSIAAVCGGCLAVVSGLGLDTATDRDPYCPGPLRP